MKFPNKWVRIFYLIYLLNGFLSILLMHSCSPGIDNLPINTNTNSTTNIQTNQDIPTFFVSNLTTTQGAQLIEQKSLSSSFILIDVRTPSEYNSGTISGAINIDYYDNFIGGISSLSVTNTYFVFCQSGGRSAAAVTEMSNSGFRYLYNLLGGFGGWVSAGLPISNP